MFQLVLHRGGPEGSDKFLMIDDLLSKSMGMGFLLILNWFRRLFLSQGDIGLL